MAEWKRFASGKYVDLANIQEKDIDLNDITTSLNQIRRFGGHYKDVPPLTVAQHTALCIILANQLFPGDAELRRAIAIHDFGEAYYGDITTPLKRILGPALLQFTKPIDKVINRKFFGQEDIPFNIKDLVKICDTLSMDIERRVMWKDQRGLDYWPESQDGFNLEMKRGLFYSVKDRYISFEEYL